MSLSVLLLETAAAPRARLDLFLLPKVSAVHDFRWLGWSGSGIRRCSLRLSKREFRYLWDQVLAQVEQLMHISVDSVLGCVVDLPDRDDFRRAAQLLTRLGQGCSFPGAIEHVCADGVVGDAATVLSVHQDAPVLLLFSFGHNEEGAGFLVACEGSK